MSYFLHILHYLIVHLLIYMCACMCGHQCTTVCVWKAKDSLWELVIFYYVDSEHQTQEVKQAPVLKKG